MSCDKIISRLIKRFGREVVFPNEVCFRAYLEPMRERADRLLPSEAGVWHSGKWIFIAPAEQKIEQGTRFESMGECFLLERLERVFFKGKPAYLWGIASKGEGGTADE